MYLSPLGIRMARLANTRKEHFDTTFIYMEGVFVWVVCVSKNKKRKII